MFGDLSDAFGPEWIADVLANIIGIALGAILPVWIFLRGQRNDREKQAEERRRARDEDLAERRRQHAIFLAEREEQLAMESAAQIQKCIDEWLRAKREARFKVVRSKLGPLASPAQREDARRDVLKSWIVDSIDAPGVEHLDSARARLLAMGASGSDLRTRIDRLTGDLSWGWLELEVDLLGDELSSISGGIDAVVASFPEDTDYSTPPAEDPAQTGQEQETDFAPDAVQLWQRILTAVGPQYRELESIIAELMSFTSSARTRIAAEL